MNWNRKRIHYSEQKNRIQFWNHYHNTKKRIWFEKTDYENRENAHHTRRKKGKCRTSSTCSGARELCSQLCCKPRWRCRISHYISLFFFVPFSEACRSSPFPFWETEAEWAENFNVVFFGSALSVRFCFGSARFAASFTTSSRITSSSSIWSWESFSPWRVLQYRPQPS